jgi:hypothetical protein
LSLADSSRLIRAFEAWSEHHPRPDDPVLQIMGLKQCYSPRQIMRELKDKTPVGLLILKVLSSAADRHGEEAIVARFERVFAQPKKRSLSAPGG